MKERDFFFLQQKIPRRALLWILFLDATRKWRFGVWVGTEIGLIRTNDTIIRLYTGVEKRQKDSRREGDANRHFHWLRLSGYQLY